MSVVRVQPMPQPVAVAVQPVAVVEQKPVVVSSQPVVVSSQPVVVSSQPVAAVSQPVVVSAQPVVVTAQPVVVTAQPVVIYKKKIKFRDMYVLPFSPSHCIVTSVCALVCVSVDMCVLYVCMHVRMLCFGSGCT